MTQNQKFLKLGTGTPTKRVRRRMEKRGVDYKETHYKRCAPLVGICSGG